MATTKPSTGILLTDAIEAVLKYWKDSEALKETSFPKYDVLLHRYALFANVHGPTLLSDQTEELAAQWITARGEKRTGEVAAPAASDQSLRRSVLRKFYRDAENLKLSESGLAVRAYVPPRTPALARPLTDAEAESVWMYASDAGPHTRRPVMFALLLSGVHSSEVGLISVADFDRANSRVWAHGDTTRIKPRWVNLAEPMLSAVIERVEYLTKWMPEFRSLESFQLTQGTSSRPMGSSQNRAASACKEIFIRAGLGSDNRITPTSVSLYAGLKMLREGARIEEVTRLLGYSSLDKCSKALGYDWETGELR